MKRLLRVLFVSARILPFVLCHAVAQAAGAGEELVHADLNGDGRQDTVRLSTKLDEYDVYTSYTVTVNGRSYSAPAPDVYEIRLAIVDVDTRDSLKEVAVTTVGSNDRDVVTIFMLEGGDIRPMPSLPGMVEYRGDGVAATTNWMGFWSIVREFRLDRARKTWELIPRDTYDVGVSATATKAFQLHESRDDKSKVSARVKPKNTIDILSCDPSPECGDSGSDTEECDWYLIRTPSGDTGWARLKEFKEKARIPWAG